jgi:hypothetical protein
MPLTKVNTAMVSSGGGDISSNTALGSSSLNSNTTGANNTAIGQQALQANTTASNNTAVGFEALKANTTGDTLTAVGYRALDANTTGYNSTAVGNNALGGNTTGNYNVAIGDTALFSNTTASYNTAVGFEAGYSNTTSTSNAYFGNQSGYSTTTANGNTFIGNQAGYSSTGGNSTYVGQGAGYYITSGSKNTILGQYPGNQGGLDIRTASNYIVLSDGDGNPRAYWRNDGKMFTTASVTDSEALQVTNSQATRPYGIAVSFTGSTPNNTTQYFFAGDDSTNAKVFIYSSGTISNRTGTYNTISDQKIKQDIIDAGSQWDDIKSVRFRKYRLIDDVKANPDAPYLLGVVAQELEQTSPNLIDNCEDKNGEVTKGVKTSVLLMKAAKALQEAMQRIETLEAKVQQLENK